MRSDLALAALASAAVPGMKPVAVAALVLEEDSDHQQAVVEDATGRRWLVRSPLTPTAGARLQRGDELVRQLSRHVPFKVPAPVGLASVGKDGHAVVYPHVEGAPLDFTHLPAGAGLASAVGRAVAAIHNIPRGLFEEQDVTVFDAAGCRQRLISEVDRAAETGRVPTGLLARWEEAFDTAPLWQFATTPVHGSFRGGSVLVAFADEDASSGRVVAVTDWEEAMVADPAGDLAELLSLAAPRAWESVLDAYTLARAQRPDPYLPARARLVAETRLLRGLALSVGSGDEQATRRVVEALRRMDRLTEAEDSLVPVAARGAGEAPGQTTPGATREPGAAVGPGGGAGQDDVPGAVGGDDATEDAGDVTSEVPVAEALAAIHTDPPVITDAELDTEDPDLAADEGDTGDDTDGSEGDEGAIETVGPQEVDSPQEVGSPGEADSPEETEVGQPTGGHDEPRGLDAAEDLDDEDRLHELYGMPSPEDERER